CAAAGTDGGADGGPFTAATDCPDDGAEGCANRAPLNGLLGLAVVRDRSFVVHSDRLSARRVDTLDNCCELIRSAIAHPDRLEIQSQVRLAADSSRRVHGR